jgi:hypothetical protein
MYLYPAQVSLRTAQKYSPLFFKLLEQEQVEIISCHWHGKIENGILIETKVPKDESVIVRSSSQMICDDKALAEWAEAGGHLVFYDDMLLRPDGSWGSTKNLLEATGSFLKKVREISVQ